MRYYSLAIANFLAAFGGGLILGKGINVLSDTDFFKEGSPLAFLIGAAFGIILLQILSERWKRFVALCFSISGGCTSIILLIIFSNYAFDEKINGVAAWFFFVFLCIRFGFWFYSRVLRVQNAAVEAEGISWVELGYHSGMALGLIIWKLMGIPVDLKIALFIDAILQIFAGIIDIVGSLRRRDLVNKSLEVNKNSVPNLLSIDSADISSKKTPFDYSLYWRITAALILLTIGFQIVTFSIVHWGNNDSGSYILACFYIGVALAALFYPSFKIKLDWKSNRKKNINSAIIYLKNLKINFNLFTIIAWAFLICLVIGISWKRLGYNGLSPSQHFDIDIRRFEDLLLLVFIATAAFFCEILVISLINQIGENEKASNINGLVVKSYGFIAIASAISLVVLGKISNLELGWLATTGLCLLGTNLLIWKRTKSL